MIRLRPFLVLALFALWASDPVIAQDRVRVPPKRPARSVEKTGGQTAPNTDAKDASSSTEKSATEPFNPLGDPKRFSRFGGWGGIGSSIGQFGLARSLLILAPPVQEELELTAEQKKSLRDWSDQMQEKGRAMGEQMREQGEASMRQMNIGAALDMMGRLNTILQENEAGVARILTAKQRKRLDQIALQMEGITALVRPEVAELITLTDEQMEQIQTIITQARFRQIGFWMQQGMAMRNAARQENRGEGAASGQPEAGTQGPPRSRRVETKAGDQTRRRDEPETAKREGDVEEADGDDRSAQRRLTNEERAERTKRFQEQFTVMRDGADALQDETVRAILKVLAPSQRSRFDKILGPPFDPNKMSAMWTSRRSNNREDDAAEASGRDPASNGRRDQKQPPRREDAGKAGDESR